MDTSHLRTPPTPRLDFLALGPDAMRAMRTLEQRIEQSGLEKSLVELVRLRVSQINGCAFCVDRHTADLRRAGEDERRLATVTVWRDTPFFDARQRAVAGLTDTFASHYKAEITLEEMLQHDVAMAYNAKATGEKYLVVPGG